MQGNIWKAGDGIMKWVSMLYVSNVFQKVFGIPKILVHPNCVLFIYWLVIDSMKYVRVGDSNAVTRLHNEIFNS